MLLGCSADATDDGNTQCPNGPGCPTVQNPSTGAGAGGASGTAGTAGIAGAAGTAAIGGAGTGAAGTMGIAGAAGVAGTAGVGGIAGAGMAGAGGTGMAAGAGGMAAASAGGEGMAGMGGSGGEAGTAGMAGTGSAGTGGAVGPSMGCGASDWPTQTDFTIDVSGTQRSYIVALPANYDPNHPYKLVFAWHYLGGTASGIARGGYYGLRSMANNTAIFVAAQGIDNAWPNTGGRDVAFTRAMLDRLLSSYCIDQDRIFSVGFSYGAIMSNTVGCQLGDVFRAIAPMSGSGPRAFGGARCVGQVAAWISHGTSDATVSFSSGQASRDHWVMTNHCQMQTMQVGDCVAYQGCDDGYPVHWCQYSGGHTQPRFAPAAIWAFFSQF